MANGGMQVKKTLTVEGAQELLRELRQQVDDFREHWYPHWLCDCDSTQHCGLCHCGHPGDPILPGRPLPFEGTFCPRCVVDLVVLADDQGKDVDFEVCKAATTLQRRDEERSAGGKDPYFLTGVAQDAAVLTLCLKTLDEREADLTELKKTHDPNCPCTEEGEFCSTCCCGAPGHLQSFSGTMPIEGAWCPDCAVEFGMLIEVVGTRYGVDLIDEAVLRRRRRSND